MALIYLGTARFASYADDYFSKTDIDAVFENGDVFCQEAIAISADQVRDISAELSVGSGCRMVVSDEAENRNFRLKLFVDPPSHNGPISQTLNSAAQWMN